MPEFYDLVEDQFGGDQAPDLFLHFLAESERMNGGKGVRPSYAYVVMRRYIRDNQMDKRQRMPTRCD